MSEGHKVKVIIRSPLGSEVFIDDAKVGMLKNIRLIHTVESAPLLSIDFYPEEVEIETAGDVPVHLNSASEPSGFLISTPCARCGTENGHTCATHFGRNNRCIISGCECHEFICPSDWICEVCGSTDGVRELPTGSMGRLTRWCAKGHA